MQMIHDMKCWAKDKFITCISSFHLRKTNCNIFSRFYLIMNLIINKMLGLSPLYSCHIFDVLDYEVSFTAADHIEAVSSPFLQKNNLCRYQWKLEKNFFPFKS